MKWNLLQNLKAMQATECKLQSERPEDISGFFRYHGFLEHAFRETFLPIKKSDQLIGFLKTNVSLFSAQSLVDCDCT